LAENINQVVLGANCAVQHLDGRLQGVATIMQSLEAQLGSWLDAQSATSSTILQGIDSVKDGQVSQNATLSAHTNMLKFQINALQSQSSALGSHREVLDSLAASTKKGLSHQLGLSMQMRQQQGETLHTVVAVKDSLARADKSVRGLALAHQTSFDGLNDAVKASSQETSGVSARVGELEQGVQTWTKETQQMSLQIGAAHEALKDSAGGAKGLSRQVANLKKSLGEGMTDLNTMVDGSLSRSQTAVTEAISAAQAETRLALTAALETAALETAALKTGVTGIREE